MPQNPDPLIHPEPSLQALDAATIAARRAYAQSSPLEHNPATIRMLDAAIEAGLQAALPIMAANTLTEAAEATETHYLMDTIDGKYQRIPRQVPVLPLKSRDWLHARAAGLWTPSATDDD